MNSDKAEAVVNASPLICLGKAGLLDLLLRSFGRIIVPQPVIEEIKAGPQNDHARLFMEAGKHFVSVSSVAVSDLIVEWDLGEGESAVLDYVSRHPETVAVIDDGAARRCARTLNMRYCGSLGVVLKAHKLGIIRDLSGAVSALKEAGLYVTHDVLSRLQDL